MPEYDEDKMCTCGCPASEHHQTWFVGGGHWYGECEFYGSNETGGMMPVHADGTLCDHVMPRGTLCGQRRWVDHCQHFTPVAIPLGPVVSQ